MSDHERVVGTVMQPSAYALRAKADGCGVANGARDERRGWPSCMTRADGCSLSYGTKAARLRSTVPEQRETSS